MRPRSVGQAASSLRPRSAGLGDRPVAVVRWASAGALPRKTSPSVAQRSPETPSVLEFAWSSQRDVEAMLGPLDSGPWVQRLRNLSELALELWPPQAAQWRTVGALVIPSARSGSQQASKDYAQALATDGRNFSPQHRATCFRALAAFRGSLRLRRRLGHLMAALVEGGLVAKLSTSELQRCIVALANSQIVPLSDSPMRDFASEGASRLQSEMPSMHLKDLYELRSAMQRCALDVKKIDTHLRTRLQDLCKPEGFKSGAASLSAAVACAQVLDEALVLRNQNIRQLLLPEVLPAGVAAEILPHALPLEGAPSSAHEFVIAMVVRSIAAGAKSLAPRHLRDVLRGVLKLQASSDRLAVQQAARVLRAIWPRLVLKLQYFGPEECSLALQSYCWQLQYSYQEKIAVGVAREHPTHDMVADVVDGSFVARSPAREQQATEDLKAKLIRPVLSRLGEMPTKEVAACLSAVAPAVREPHVLNESERVFLKSAVDRAFPSEESSREGRGKRWDDFSSDYWAGELLSMEANELLDLACGLRETGCGADWVVRSVLAELEERLRPPGKARPAVELSHFTLLRLCRVMDMWQGHAVEEMLTQLLSSPEAVKPLPTPYFVAVLSALCSFLVPKEVPLRLTASFVDRVDAGERHVKAEHWFEILRAIRAMDDPPSWERITPRIVSHLVPHIGSLSVGDLSSLLSVLASRGRLADFGHAGDSSDCALERIPQATNDAVRKVVQDGKWEFEQVAAGFESLGKLDWYCESSVSAILASLAQKPLLEPHAPMLLPLSRACFNLRIHHAPLLHKMVVWYCWCYTYLRPKPLPSEHLDEMLEFAEHLIALSFQSLELQGVLAENLRNPNATPRQVLALLSALARFSHFPPEFKEACARVCAESSDSDLVALNTSDLVNAFNIHLCAVFDGPAALKHWLTEDEAMKAFFQVHTSQKWYQKQDQERTTFLQSDQYLTLRQALEASGFEMQPSSPGEVYHVEFVSHNAKDRLQDAGNPPTAVVCIKSKEQLRWYVPITAEGMLAEGDTPQNRCLQFRYMFRGAVQKMRHLQAMGYKTSVVWMSEWNALETEEQRQEYLSLALGAPGPQSTAFSPSSSEEQAIYQ